MSCCSAEQGYRLRKRSRETRDKMARMARAIYEVDEDEDSSDSSSSDGAKRPRSHVRASATKRERARMHKLNNAYDKLRQVVPKIGPDNERLSKIATLRLAIDYINMLSNYLRGQKENEGNENSSNEDRTSMDVRNGSSEDTTATDISENSSNEDSQANNDSAILVKLIDAIVEEFGWFL